MASTTKKFTLTSAWVDISEGNTDVHVQVLSADVAELHFAANSAPSTSAIGRQLSSSDADGFGVSGITTADRLWARAQDGDATILVMQKA